MIESSPETVTEALVLLGQHGYDHDFALLGGNLVCSGCGTTHSARDINVDWQFRFEGDTDPGDEAIVLGLRCTECGTKASFVAAYGHDASPSEARLMRDLSMRERPRF